MAIENEFKYLMGVDVMGDLHKKITQRKREHGDVRELEITQFYIEGSGSTRVRKTTENNITTFTHTTKYLANGETIEIECPITESDYLGITQSQKGFQLIKTRFVLDINNMNWEVDFFKSDGFVGDFYLSMVEVEVPREVKARPHLPQFFLPFFVYDVQKWNESFMNKNMISASTTYTVAAEYTKKARNG